MGPGLRRGDTPGAAPPPPGPGSAGPYPAACGHNSRPQFPFGNLALTQIIVWLGAQKSRRSAFVLTCWQGNPDPAFGRAPNDTVERGLPRWRMSPRLMRGCGTGSRLLPEALGRKA